MDRRLLVLAAGMFAVGTDNFVVAGILPSISTSLNTSASAAGQMVSIYALSFAILAPVVAAVAGGWSRKFLLLSALGIFVVGNALSAVANDLNIVLISRALAGLGAAMFAPTALGAAASLVAHEKGARPCNRHSGTCRCNRTGSPDRHIYRRLGRVAWHTLVRRCAWPDCDGRRLTNASGHPDTSAYHPA